MKKINRIMLSAAFVFALFSGNTVFAQKGPYIGIKGSVVNPWLVNEDDLDNDNLDYKATVRPAFGIEAGYNITNHIGLGIEGLYAMNGQRYEANGSKFTQRLDYIKVPVFFSYNTNPEKPVILRAKVGPQFAFLTNAKIVDSDGNKLVDDNKKQFASTNIGAAAGFGVDFRLTDHLLLTSGIRFDLGFTNTENKDYEFYDSNRAISYNTSRAIELGLRYVIK